MRIVFFIFLGILALNAVVILAITGILVLDQIKARRRRVQGEAASDDAHANAQ